jgi:PadR family transcriptional regulator AphA
MQENRTSTEFAVLGLLTLKPMSGYEMRQLVTQSIGHFWSESYGQIYPSLKRLVNGGLVTKKTDPSSKRDKHIYQITDEGRTQLDRWRAAAPKPQPTRNELLLKLFLNEDPAIALEHVTNARLQAIDQLRQLGFLEEKLRSEHSDDSRSFAGLATLEYDRYRAEAVVRWADAVLAELAPQR